MPKRPNLHGTPARARVGGPLVQCGGMKRVLLITHAFPPEPLPGALRPGYLARYLPEYGWQATVLTPARERPAFPADIIEAGRAAPPASSERIRAMLPKGGPVRAILRLLKETLIFPDELAGWIPPAVAAGLRVMRQQRFDAILTTALPTSTHVIGAVLSRSGGVPWLADYRDLWSGNPYMGWGPVKSRVQKMAELLAMRRAAHLTTVSEPLARELRALHGKDVSVIENAYDPSDWDEVPDEPPRGFDLVYTGTMYGGKRSPQLLFRALARLREERHPAAAALIHFYGKNNDAALDEAKTFGLESQVRVHGMVPRSEALLAQRRSAAVLIFLSMDPATAKETGSKYLEYLGSRRPMLVFGPSGSVMRETISALNAGYFASETGEAERALRSLYEQYVSGRYAVTADLSRVQTAETLTAAFAGHLDAIARPAGAEQTFYRASSPRSGLRKTQ